MKKMIIMSLFVATTLFSMNVTELNKASKSELMKINGVGSAKADAIIKYRKNTPFKTISDVENVKGIGASISKNIKNDVYKKSNTKKKKKESKDTNSTKKTTK
jgi:competence protein ComEA